MIISKDLKANVRKSIIFNFGKTKYISGFFFLKQTMDIGGFIGIIEYNTLCLGYE